MTVHAVARLVYEAATLGQFPLHIWASAMMYLHAFEESTAEREEDEETGQRSLAATAAQPARLEHLLLGVACLVLAVKGNENFLNSVEPERGTTARLAAVLDASARTILSYTGSSVPTERLVQTKRKLKEFIPATELSVMRIVGNELEPETAFSLSPTNLHAQAVDILVEIYSSPVCLNYPAGTLLKFAHGEQHHTALMDAISPFFLTSSDFVEPISP